MRNFIFFLIGASIFAIGESVECYNCVEGEGTDKEILFAKCVLPFSKNDNNPRCTKDGYCLKTTVTGDKKFGLRTCISFEEVGPGVSVGSPIEITVGNNKMITSICDTNLCNAASIPTTTTSFVILLLITFFVF